MASALHAKERDLNWARSRSVMDRNYVQQQSIARGSCPDWCENRSIEKEVLY